MTLAHAIQVRREIHRENSMMIFRDERHFTRRDQNTAQNRSIASQDAQSSRCGVHPSQSCSLRTSNLLGRSASAALNRPNV